MLYFRALELAIKHKTHVDTVLAFRQKYLQEFGQVRNLIVELIMTDLFNNILVTRKLSALPSFIFHKV